MKSTQPEALFRSLPAERGQSRACTHPDHAVQFYESDEYLCDMVSGFLTEGLLAQLPLIVIATPERRSGVIQRLESAGLDIEQARLDGRAIFVDAREMLTTFMVGDLPDETLFRTHVGGLVEQTLRMSDARQVRAYGEMVDLLWRDGKPNAAVRLEELWNELAEVHSFALLCAYSMGNFYREAHTEQFQEICRQHGRVFPAEAYLQARDEDRRAREVSLLQQRARALESEIAYRRKLEQALRTALSERRKAMRELREAKEVAERADRAKSDFLAVMSHELRTPLNAIVGYQELLELEVAGPSTPAQQLFLERIKSGAHHLLGLIDQILSLSRNEAGEEHAIVERVDIAAVAREACALVEPAAARKGLVLDAVTPEEAVLCETDSHKLVQILLNLLTNAVKFTRGGTVRLTVRRDGESVRLEVADTGVGIAGADLERIFDPFVQVDASTTRANGGAGLGLAVSRNLARLLGGDITVSSAETQGSTFTVWLPARL